MTGDAILIRRSAWSIAFAIRCVSFSARFGVNQARTPSEAAVETLPERRTRFVCHSCSKSSA